MPTALEYLVGEMTLAELARRSGKSIESIATWALGGHPSKRKSRGASAGQGSKIVDTRSQAGRKVFDAKVLLAIGEAGGEVRTGDIEKTVGGTALQRRTALARLVKSRKLKRSGAARATTYALRP